MELVFAYLLFTCALNFMSRYKLQDPDMLTNFIKDL